MSDFIHLRVHSAYSLAQGAIRTNQLLDFCVEQNMPAVAITDTDNCFVAREFSLAAQSKSVQPIIGICLHIGVYKTGQKYANDDFFLAPIPLIVQNHKGWESLTHLLKVAYMDTPNGQQPHIAIEDLLLAHEGLIALTGAANGPLGRLLLEGLNDKAEEMLSQLHHTFKDRLYMEIMRHGLKDEQETEKWFIEQALVKNIPLVATNDAYFVDAKMHEAQDVLMCISEGTTISNDNRKHLTPFHYLRSEKEMKAAFKDLPEAIENTVKIAKRCAFLVDAQPPELPRFESSEGRTEVEELKHQSYIGLEKRLNDQVYSADMDAQAQKEKHNFYFERLDYELDVIAQMGFPGYFLIVADFIKKAKEMEIPVGPGRGSGAGSLVAWALTITDIDPIPFNLLFERFLNPERVSMPDFDIDFCQSRREEVIQYVQEKYGKDKVAQIITFGKLQAKAAIRDVGRVLEMGYGEVDNIAKRIPTDDPKITIQKAYDNDKDFREVINANDNSIQLKNVALQLEGLYRNASTHAAGVVIGARPLEKITPLYRDPRSPMPVTGFNMSYIEDTGLIKFDFLGLKTLTVLKNGVDLIKQTENIDINLSTIPLKDEKTFKMLSQGDTVGVFQLESPGMQKVLIGVQPDSLEDLIAVVSLYRPGPMDNIPSYQRRKAGTEKSEYLHPMLEPILSETYGIMVYQEQVMQIAQTMAGYTLGGADLLRRAMGKKKKEEMDKQSETFVMGAQKNGIEKDTAIAVFEQMAKFASYGFNKSHAAAYAFVAWQTAWMKAHYPAEFLAANMTLDYTNTDKLNSFVQDAKDHNVKVLPPEINHSAPHFTVEITKDGEKAIRYGLAAIKGVGEGAMELIIKERNENGLFKDIHDFATRVDSAAINKRLLERLAKAGAFDAILPNRKQIADSIDEITSFIQTASKERTSEQFGLFGGEVQLENKIRLKETNDWDQTDRLDQEYDVIGFYLTGHPVDVWKKELNLLGVRKYVTIKDLMHTERVSLAGNIVNIRRITTKKGDRMAILTISDPSGIFETVLFPKNYEKYGSLLETGELIFIRATVKRKDGDLSIEAGRIMNLEQAVNANSSSLLIGIEGATALDEIADLLNESKEGNAFAHLEMNVDQTTILNILLKSHFTIDPKVIMRLRNLPTVYKVEQLFD
ncbi:MAG: DNA polymerase III subunit alpha [Alphaproteobacteria bacterium]